ncbi:cache domain-containing protein [bacterium]|nr:cache domain-containing protein [bacterium]
MKALSRFRDYPIRYKLLVSYSLAFFLVITLSSVVINSFVRKTIEANIESELQNSTSAILDLVKTSASVSIKNYFRATAERNRELVTHYYQRYQNGELTLEQAKSLAGEFLRSQKIGKSGYIYCADSFGNAVIHPRKGVEGRNFIDQDFVKKIIAGKEVYVEYDWKNPGEEKERPKAVYSNYFEPWDWIICISAYREEFTELVNVDDFRESVLSFRFGKTGYSYLLNADGVVIVHPKQLVGKNFFDVNDSNGRKFVQEMLNQKSGKITYAWQNPDEDQKRQKLVIFNFLPEFNWVVASSSYLDEIYAPLTTVRNIIAISGVISLVLVAFLAFWISSLITSPLRELMKQFAAGADQDFSVRMEQRSKDEMGTLALYFNDFMEQLEAYSTKIEKEVAERKLAEREVMKISERERKQIGQDLHDDLCPHLIGIEVLSDVLETKLRRKSAVEANAAKKIKILVRDAIKKAKGIARGLCPVHLLDHGLDYSLKELALSINEIYAVSCEFESNAKVSVLDKVKASHLVYIVQEAVQNAIKHGAADKISITLKNKGRFICLNIIDNGAGIKHGKNSRGMGLRIMEFRAKMIGATFNIEPYESGGTSVEITFSNINAEQVKN